MWCRTTTTSNCSPQGCGGRALSDVFYRNDEVELTELKAQREAWSGGKDSAPATPAPTATGGRRLVAHAVHPSTHPAAARPRHTGRRAVVEDGVER